MLTAIEIFCCYAREDQSLLQHLKNHLMPLQWQELIRIWSDTDINAGDEWEQSINQHLETAEIILLLISSDFMASQYCYSKEMRRAMQRHEQGEARVIPVLLRPTYWKGAPFEKLQFLPTDARPITDRNWTEDEALYDVVEQIGAAVKTVRLKRALSEAKKLVDEQHFEEALILCEQALIIEPQHAPALREKGEIFLALKRYKESLDTLDQAHQIDPHIADLLFYQNRAHAFSELQQYDEAILAYDQALQFNPQSMYLLQAKAALLEKTHQLPAALVIYEKLSHLDVQNAFYCEVMGDLFLHLRQPQKALTAYEQALQRNFVDIGVYEKQGELLLELERYEEAQKAMAHAISIVPENAHLYFLHGKALLSLDRYQEAIGAFQTSIEQNFYDLFSSYHGIGQALFASGDAEAALTAYKQALAHADSPLDPQFYHDQGKAYESLAQQSYKEEQIARALWKPLKAHVLIGHTLADNLEGIDVLYILQETGNRVAFSPDGKLLASGSGSGNGMVKLWNPQTGQEVRTLTGHKSYVNVIVFSPDGRLLASGGQDQTVKLWNPQTGQEVRTLTGHTGNVYRVAFSPDGQLLASSYDQTIKLWNPQTGQEVRTFTGHTSYVYGVAFSPDGKLLASASNDKTIKLWSPQTGRELRTLTGHQELVYSVAFSSDGKLLASASGDKTIKLWNPQRGQEVRTLTGHESAVYGLAFSSDEKLLASGSNDKTIKLWNPQTGQEVRTLTGHTDTLVGVAFSPDGKLLASASNDKTVRIWGN